MHRRTTIADAVRAALQAQLDSVPIATTVTVGRVYPSDFDTMPAVNVALGPEAVIDDGEFAASDPDQIRRLELDVEIWINAESGVDAAADAIALEVERALGPGLSASIVDELKYRGSEAPERDALEGPVIIRTLSYTADFLVDRTNPV